MSHLFETETCGRCGGTGHYSYNQMHGTTCYGCGGKKVRLTKRGAAAQRWYIGQQTISFDKLKVGDLIWQENFFGGYTAWFTVDKIDGDTISISFQRKHRPKPDELTLQGYAGQTFRVRPRTKEEVRWQQMVGLAYQATLTKEGKVRK